MTLSERLGGTNSNFPLTIFNTATIAAMEAALIDKGGKEQLMSYRHATGAPIARWSDGTQAVIWHRKSPHSFVEIPAPPPPARSSTTSPGSRGLSSPCSTRSVSARRGGQHARFEEMEDEVLANAGADVFEAGWSWAIEPLKEEGRVGQQREKRGARSYRTRDQESSR